ncbi:MAG: hypothetical protein OXI22_01180 [Defluviicoccus sp.]|nr:hypothetical protein [Defluviicoccus sp.]MDE0382472.1 hypothetical protein [Defluviicoccus sp.]
MKQSIRSFVRFVRQTRAVSALEYAILVGIIAVAVGGALATFGDNITKALKTVGDSVDKTAVGTVTAKKP